MRRRGTHLGSPDEESQRLSEQQRHELDFEDQTDFILQNLYSGMGLNREDAPILNNNDNPPLYAQLTQQTLTERQYQHNIENSLPLSTPTGPRGRRGIPRTEKPSTIMNMTQPHAVNTLEFGNAQALRELQSQPRDQELETVEALRQEQRMLIAQTQASRREWQNAEAQRHHRPESALQRTRRLELYDQYRLMRSLTRDINAELFLNKRQAREFRRIQKEARSDPYDFLQWTSPGSALEEENISLNANPNAEAHRRRIEHQAVENALAHTDEIVSNEAMETAEEVIASLLNEATQRSWLALEQHLPEEMIDRNVAEFVLQHGQNQDLVDYLNYFAEESPRANMEGLIFHARTNALLEGGTMYYTTGPGTAAARELFLIDPEGYREKFGHSRVQRSFRMLTENRQLPADPTTQVTIIPVFQDPITGQGLNPDYPEVDVPAELMVAHTYFVASQVDDQRKPLYIVQLYDDVHGQCDCDDFIFRGLTTPKITNCKHMFAARWRLDTVDRAQLYANRRALMTAFAPDSILLPEDISRFRGLEQIQRPVYEYTAAFKSPFEPIRMSARRFLDHPEKLTYVHELLQKPRDQWQLVYFQALEEHLSKEGVLSPDWVLFSAAITTKLRRDEKALVQMARLLLPYAYKRLNYDIMSPTFFMIRAILTVGVEKMLQMNELELDQFLADYEYRQRIRRAKYNEWANAHQNANNYRDTVDTILRGIDQADERLLHASKKQIFREIGAATMLQVFLDLRHLEGATLEEEGYSPPLSETQEDPMMPITTALQQNLPMRISDTPVHPLDATNPDYVTISSAEALTLQQAGLIDHVVPSPASPTPATPTTPRSSQTMTRTESNALRDQAEMQRLLVEQNDTWIDSPVIQEPRTPEPYVYWLNEEDLERMRPPEPQWFTRKKQREASTARARASARTPQSTQSTIPGPIAITKTPKVVFRRKPLRNRKEIEDARKQIVDLQMQQRVGNFTPWISRQEQKSATFQRAESLLSSGTAEIIDTPSSRTRFDRAQQYLEDANQDIQTLAAKMKALKGSPTFSKSQPSTQNVFTVVKILLGNLQNVINPIRWVYQDASALKSETLPRTKKAFGNYAARVSALESFFEEIEKGEDEDKKRILSALKLSQGIDWRVMVGKMNLDIRNAFEQIFEAYKEAEAPDTQRSLSQISETFSDDFMEELRRLQGEESNRNSQSPNQ